MSQNAEDGNENRSSKRSKTLRGGTIIFNKGWSSAPCDIVDVSEGGARLRLLDPTFQCPEEFKLRSDSTGQTRLCAVVWRRSHDIGIRWIVDIGDL